MPDRFGGSSTGPSAQTTTPTSSIADRPCCPAAVGFDESKGSTKASVLGSDPAAPTRGPATVSHQHTSKIVLGKGLSARDAGSSPKAADAQAGAKWPPSPRQPGCSARASARAEPVPPQEQLLPVARLPVHRFKAVTATPWIGPRLQV